MLRYYQIDLVSVVNGEGPSPRLVLAAAEALPHDSMTYALRMGGPQFHGWDETRAILAAIFDSINMNTVATGHWKGKPPSPTPWKRPAKEKPLENKTTVKELYARFNRRK